MAGPLEGFVTGVTTAPVCFETFYSDTCARIHGISGVSSPTFSLITHARYTLVTLVTLVTGLILLKNPGHHFAAHPCDTGAGLK